MFLPDARFNENDETSGNKNAKRHRQLNFDLCQAVDLTKLGIALDTLVKEAGMHPNVAKAFEAQAAGLRALLQSENNRLHGI